MANKKRTSAVTAAQIRELRGPMSQTAASHLCGICVRSWRNHELGKVAMSQAVFNECRGIIENYHAMHARP